MLLLAGRGDFKPLTIGAETWCSHAEEWVSVAFTKGQRIATEERETHHRKEKQRDMMCGVKQIRHLCETDGGSACARHPLITGN